MVEQRLPTVDGDDGSWGDILNLFLSKEHYNSGSNSTANGGHQNISIRPGVASAGGAPITFSSGTNLTTAAAGAMEYDGSYFYLTPNSTTPVRTKMVMESTATPATGDILYRDSTNNFSRLAVGSSGTILTGGTTPTWTSASGIGSSSPTSNTIAEWDGNKNLSANNFIPATQSTVTAATTTTITIGGTNSAQVQIFTGTTTQTVSLPTTSIAAGAEYTIINQSTGAVTVNASGGATVTTLAGSTTGVFIAVTATPTTAAGWIADITTAGTTMTFPATSATIARTDAAQTFTGVQTFAAPILGTPTSATLTNATGLPIASGVSGLGTGVATFLGAPSSANLASALTDETGTAGRVVFSTSPTLANTTMAAGTATAAPLVFTSGTNLTTAAAGAMEYDGVGIYQTNETTSGRGLIPTEQKFRLTATGATIGATAANYFGTTSNISLVSGAEYEIEIDCWFLKTTAGTVTWTFTNTAAPTSMNLEYKFSAVGGIVSSPAATSLFGDQYNITAAAPTVVSASLTTGVNHHHKFWIRLINSTGTSLKIQATCSAGTITPGINSSWKACRVPLSNIGNFAA